MELCNDNDTKLVLHNETTISMKPYVPYILGVSMAVLIIVTVIGNAMTVAAYIIDKRLRNVYNTFILNLAVTDLLIGLISMPFHAAYTVGEFNWYLGRDFCKFWLVVNYTLCFESVLMILMLSYDRYQLIRYGLSYESKVTMKGSIAKIVITWIVAFLLWGPFIIGWDIWKECTIVDENVCEVEFLYAYEYLLTTAVIGFFMPFKGLMIINSILYCKLRRFLSKVKLTEDDTEGLTSDTLETLTDGEDATPANSPTGEGGVALEQTEGVVKSENETTKERKQVDKTDATSTTSKHENLVENTLTKSDNVSLPHNRNDANDAQESYDDKEKLVPSETIDHYGEIDRQSNQEEHFTNMEANLQCSTNQSVDTEDSISHRSPKHKRQGNGETSAALTDTADTDQSEIMKSVLDVMEKHGSRLFSSNSKENILDCTENIEEDAGDVSGTSSLESNKSLTEIKSTLKRKFSDVASKFFGAAQPVENVSLENVKQRKHSVERKKSFERSSGTGKDYKEVDIDQAIRERKAHNPISQQHKESMTSNVTSRIRRDKKAARFLAILVGVFFICWAPYTIATVWQVFCPQSKKSCINRIVYEALTWLLWSKSAINPFLYAYNSSRYKLNFKKFLSCCCKKETRGKKTVKV